jgi:hypothetical protein
MSHPADPILPPPPAVQHVRDQQYVATCAQCRRQARGAFHEFVEGGWAVKDGAQYGQDGAVFFCPSCVFGLAAVATPAPS